MKKINTNNFLLFLGHQFRKYKYFSGFYLLILFLLYPLYYFINDHNIKYYKFSYDLNSTSPLIIREDKPVANLKKLNLSINNEILNEVYSLPLKKNNSINIKCSPVELENSCIIKIKNGNYKLISSINEKIISAISSVDFRYKDKLNESIKRYEMDIKLLLNSSDSINKLFNDRNLNISESSDLGNILEILVNNSLQVNELRSEINLIRSEVIEIENFIEAARESLEHQKLKLVNDGKFANYSLKTHFLSFFVGCILMVFSFLILIRD